MSQEKYQRESRWQAELCLHNEANKEAVYLIVILIFTDAKLPPFFSSV
jgi:hypothetical protein